MTAHPSRVTETPSSMRRPWSAVTSTRHEWSGAGDASLSGSQLIGNNVSLAGVSDGGLNDSEARSVLLTDPRLSSLPSRLAEIASRRPGSARVVTPLRRHVDALIEHETGLPQETPEEYAERLEKERKEDEELLHQLKEEEEEEEEEDTLREKARNAEEDDAIQRFEQNFCHDPG